MKSKLHVVQVAEAEHASGVPLPEHVQLSLAGIAGQAKEGLLALAVGTGLAVLHETMEWASSGSWASRAVATRIGRASVRAHGRGGHARGGRVPLSRPRVRTADDSAEIGLETYREFASRELLEQVILERMLAGVSTGRSQSPSVSRSRPWRGRRRSRRVSRSFVARTRTALAELLAAICLSWSWRW